jgi:hypothetical protein
MITSTYGVVTTLEPSDPPLGASFLFAAGGMIGFAVLLSSITAFGDDDAEADGIKTVALASLLNILSVLGAVGAGAAVAAVGNGLGIWLLAPLVASAVYLPLNGLEYALAEAEEDDEDGGG